MTEHDALQEIKAMLERIENIIDSRLVGLVDPVDDEREAIARYESLKEKGELELTEL